MSDRGHIHSKFASITSSLRFHQKAAYRTKAADRTCPFSPFRPFSPFQGQDDSYPFFVDVPLGTVVLTAVSLARINAAGKRGSRINTIAVVPALR
jgi:hypothetical protein